MAPTTKRIAESEWEAHRATIERMYCQENRTQKEVQMFMSNTHGFSATKWQYETHFKAWNLKKNYSQEEWANMDSAIRRGEVDVSSAPSIYLGRPLSSKRVKKALTRRQCNPTTASTSSHLNSPAALPPGLTLPNAGPANRGPPSQMPSTSPDANLVPATLPPQNAIDSVQLWCPSPPQPTTALQYPTSAGIDPWVTGAMPWPRAVLYSTELTPSLMFISWLSGPRGHYAERQSILYPLQDLSEEAARFLATTLEMSTRLSDELGSLKEEQRVPKIDAKMFRRILPFSALKLLEASTVTENYASQISKADCAVFYLFIHALSNNMIDRLGFRSLGHMWRSLKGHLGRHIEYHFARVVRTRYSKTLSWKILQGAIEVNDAGAVRQIIRQWDIKVDEVCCFGRNREAFTAVEVASGFLAAEVLQVLLGDDADVNKTGPYTREEYNILGGGAFIWTLQSEKLWRMFMDGESDLLPPSVEMRQEIVSQLAMAGMKPPLTATRLVDLHEHVERTSELQELASCMIDTSLDSVVEELIFEEIRSEGEGESFGSRAEAQDERARIVRLLQCCVPPDTNDWVTIREKFGALLSRAQPQRHVIGHDLLSFQYQEESGFRVFISEKPCQCDNAARECAYFPLGMLPPPRVPPYKQLADRLRELARPGHTQELMTEVETALGEDSRVFWEAVFSLGGFRRGFVQFSMLSAAIEDQNEALICKLVELDQDVLYISKAMLELRPTNGELYRLVTAASVFTGTRSGFQQFGIYNSLHFFGTILDLTHRGDTDELCAAICRGDCAEIQHVLDVTQLCPWESGALARALSHEGAGPSTAVFDTLRHHQPKPCPIRSVERMGNALLAAARNGHVSVVQHIMQGHDLDVHIIIQKSRSNYFHYSLLGDVVQLTDPHSQQCCQIVIRNGCRLGEVDRAAGLVGEISTRMSVVTPLLLAIRAGAFLIVKLLVVEYGADINLAPIRGIRRTPLQQAAESGHDDIARWLIDHGALINGPIHQRGGATALQLASIGGYGGIMEMLINRGADLDALGAVVHGRTALEGAAEHGRLDAVKLLLNSGTSTTGGGKESLLRAIQFAHKRGHISVAELLEDHHDGRCAPDELEMDGGLPIDSAAMGLTDLSEQYFEFTRAYPSCS